MLPNAIVALVYITPQ